MTSLMGAKKRAEEFAAAVDGGPASAELRPELAQLTGVVAAMRSAERPAPRADFSVSLRERLVAEAATTLTQNASLTLPPRKRGTRERRLVVAASAFVLVGGSAGMAAAAQGALPGDALYPIKRGLERAQTDLTTNELSRGTGVLDQAESRLAEVQGLLDSSGGSPQVPDTINAFTAQAQEGADLLMQAFEADRDPEAIVAVREFAAGSLVTLQELAKVAPDGSQPALTNAAAVLQQIDAAAAAACMACAPELPALNTASMLSGFEVAKVLKSVKLESIDNSHPPLNGKPAPAKPAKGDNQPTADQPTEPGKVTPTPAPGDVDPLAPVEGVTGGILEDLTDTVEGLTDPLTGLLQKP